VEGNPADASGQQKRQRSLCIAACVACLYVLIRPCASDTDSDFGINAQWCHVGECNVCVPLDVLVSGVQCLRQVQAREQGWEEEVEVVVVVVVLLLLLLLVVVVVLLLLLLVKVVKVVAVVKVRFARCVAAVAHYC
jgi:hypothetical protein